MTTEDKKYIAVFGSHNHATLLYKKLLNLGCKVELIQTPIKISKGCSKSIRFNQKDIDIIRNEIIKNGIKCLGIFKKN